MRGTIGTFAAVAALTLLGACTSGAADPPSTSPPVSPAPTSTPVRTPPTSPPSSAPSFSAHRIHPSTTAPTSTSSVTRTHPAPTSSPAPTAHALPLDYSTETARQVITVVAAAHSSTIATLQAWQRGDHGWTRVGPAVRAWLGTGGIGPTNEQSTVTPAGSFTLTQAFGRNADPGTALPYRQTTPADWWISQPGPLYNTEQHCSADCPFTQGDPNEHLYYATPYYEYAVVVDYNRFPVHQGAGSAFFLHVTVGEPTQGCVSIDRGQLVRIMRWLDPRQHPRILMGLG